MRFLEQRETDAGLQRNRDRQNSRLLRERSRSGVSGSGRHISAPSGARSLCAQNLLGCTALRPALAAACLPHSSSYRGREKGAAVPEQRQPRAAGAPLRLPLSRHHGLHGRRGTLPVADAVDPMPPGRVRSQPPGKTDLSGLKCPLVPETSFLGGVVIF